MDNKKLENEFIKLSYKQIRLILEELGTRFVKPIENIKKQEIYATLEYDYLIDKIKKVIIKIKTKYPQ